MNQAVNIAFWAIYILSLYFAVFWFLVLMFKGFGHNQPKITKYPFVTIAIPAYNEERNLKSTVDNLLKLNYPKEKYEVIIVNDGSRDRTSQVAKQLIRNHHGFDIRLIEQENNGKGSAINRALKIAKGEFFIVLDADSYPEKDALVNILPHFENSDVAVVLPAMKVWEPKNLIQKIQRSEYIVNMFYKRIMSNLNCVPVIPGPFSVYRTKILRDVGGFENRNLTEDLEITLRLHSKHHRIVQLLSPVVYTKAPETPKALYKQRNRWFKGTVLNVLRYRWMAFNKQYGDYGMIQIPMTLIAGLLALGLFGMFLYSAIGPNLTLLKNLFLVKFDILTLLMNLKFNFNLFDPNYALVFSMIMMIAMTLIIAYLAHKSLKEKVFKHGIIPFAIFFLVYYLAMGVFWTGVFINLLTGKKQKW